MHYGQSLPARSDFHDFTAISASFRQDSSCVGSRMHPQATNWFSEGTSVRRPGAVRCQHEVKACRLNWPGREICLVVHAETRLASDWNCVWYVLCHVCLSRGCTRDVPKSSWPMAGVCGCPLRECVRPRWKNCPVPPGQRCATPGRRWREASEAIALHGGRRRNFRFVGHGHDTRPTRQQSWAGACRV